MKINMSETGRRLLLASAVAVVVVVVVVWLFQMDENADAAPVKTVPVLVAKSYIASQSALELACCYEKRIPESYAPPRPLLKKDLGLGSGRARFRARGEILKGEILTASRVSDAATAASAGWDMGENEMAVMVHLTPESAMAGVVSAGDTVNLLATFEKRSCVLVLGARVLAVGKRTARVVEETAATSSDETLVTLTLEPRDAMRTVLASQKALLSLALISPLGNAAPPACVALGDL